MANHLVRWNLTSLSLAKVFYITTTHIEKAAEDLQDTMTTSLRFRLQVSLSTTPTGTQPPNVSSK